MSLFVCAKCGCIDNTATSSYWMLTNEYMVDKCQGTTAVQGQGAVQRMREAGYQP